ncbi:MAG: 4Fe-4S dicluster domain-containing protein [Lentisphaerae bacterium]|nr:4Fe-4S dicluster domain-containing protein [Lentisphaerota bacterium]MCP4101797.1 4Fe-4S dicluster domain-containing protein [Lentisphaerota bacterium]
MKVANNAERIRRELLIRIIRNFMRGTLKDVIDRIAVDMRPRKERPSRCCVYKDRAVLKYRVMAMLGFGIEDEIDEAKALSKYLKEATERQAPDDNILSVLDVACSACVESQYLVTNACRGCFARPCTFNCPRDAIQVVDGQARIDHSLCIDCGKCTKVCPYHAIIRVPIPCEEACPVNAIKKRSDGTQVINFKSCISCGKCMQACPFGAILERSQIIDVLNAIKKGKKVVAMVAPSIVGQFPGKLAQIAEAVKLVGFELMEEVAHGAQMTTEHETKEFFEHMEQGDHIMTSSCCPAYVETVKKHVPLLQPYVSDTPSPMRFTARVVKEKYGCDCVSVFIGPCVAKRKEAQRSPKVDYVLTFEELGSFFAAMNIDVASLKGIKLPRKVEGYARGFASSCGVTSAMLKESTKTVADSNLDNDAKFINGLDQKTVKQLHLYGKGKLPGNFLEVMACEGGCVGGPCVLGDVKLATRAVKASTEE